MDTITSIDDTLEQTANPINLLAYLIAHAPPIPMGHLEYEDTQEKVDNSYAQLFSPPRTIPHAIRHARWRMEYAEAQIAAMNNVSKSKVDLEYVNLEMARIAEEEKERGEGL